MTSLSDIKRRTLFALLAGYLLFDYAFMQIRIPPSGFGVPLGEIFLIFVLMTTDIPLVLSRLSSIVYLLPFLVWWTYGIGRAADDAMGRGFWALRDATSVIESLYVIVGFAIAGGTNTIERLARWLPIILAITCVYGLGYAFKSEIQAISPSVIGAAREPLPLLGDYAITGTVMLWTAFYCLIVSWKAGIWRHLRVPIAGLLIAFVITIIQARTSYLQLLGIVVILLLFRPRAIGRLAVALPILFFFVFVVSAFDLHIAGRLSDKVSFSFLAEHIETIFGIGTNDPGSLGMAAQGVDMRFGWWETIYERLTADSATLLTGLGYGIPLTNFHDEFGDLVREPHNSYISVVARLGVLGFVAWAWMQVELFRGWLRAYRASQRARWQDGEIVLLMIVAFAVLVLIEAIGEDALEKPYHAIPLYTLWGMALRIAYAFNESACIKTDAPAPAQHFARKAGASSQ
ncbi:MAG TPA: O-antigen ligase family protein [Xanthobacteraceae bacterium]|nr:O-antigen ligase family protein [Xanthobacteraceae bacterium]